MSKRAGILASIISLFLFLLTPGLVEARGPTVVKSSVVTEFPLQITFKISTKSEVTIADIRLHFASEQESYADVTDEAYVEFMPSNTVETQWSWDMKKAGGLPPGCTLQYWWTVEDTNGDKTSTAPASVKFEDNRFSWRDLTEQNVTIYWHYGNESFAGEIMSAAQQTLARLFAETGVRLEHPVQIYIYASPQELQGALIFPQEWAGGIAYYQYDIIAIGISPDQLTWGDKAIAHELTHLAVHQMTLNPYGSLPTWLDEGLAMYGEGTLDPSFAIFLERAIDSKNLISVRSLSSPFSAFTEESYLSYAESYSIIDFLITKFGQGKMIELLNTFSQGNSYDGALEKVYGFDRDGLDTLWQADVTRHYQESEANAKISMPALALVSAALATAFLFILSLAIEKWAWRRGW